MSINTWYHIAATLNPSSLEECKLYINGESVSGSSVNDQIAGPTTSSGAYPLVLGNAIQGGSAHTGSIAQIAVYNRVLSPSEIKQNYEVTRRRFGL